MTNVFTTNQPKCLRYTMFCRVQPSVIIVIIILGSLCHISTIYETESRKGKIRLPLFVSKGFKGSHTSQEVLENQTHVEVQMEHCSCIRTIPKATSHKDYLKEEDPQTINLQDTTCSSDAFMRGPGQKVVAFSFYVARTPVMEKIKGYFKGIQENLILMHQYYPGWTMRLYFDIDPKDNLMEELCQTACRDNTLDLCNARHLPGTPMVDARHIFAMDWRFFPTLDPQVAVYVCRDLDSRFSDREAAAVAEWLASDEPIHGMRDHPLHQSPLLGASWGCHMQKKSARKLWKESWKSMLQDPLAFKPRHGEKGPDQDLLTKYVWPWGIVISLQHDSYHCLSYPKRIMRPFPTQRKNEPNNFVAAITVRNTTLWEECPPECRPKEHQDWTHC